MAEEQKFYLTKEGLKRIKKEYNNLKVFRLEKVKGNKRPEILHSQDLDPEYFTFQEDLDRLDLRIVELGDVLDNVEIIKTPSKKERNTVHLGATVTLEEDGKINEFMIVGSLEANPSEGKISSESPVGKALLGKKTGEEVLITSPIKVVYKIKKIRYLLG